MIEKEEWEMYTYIIIDDEPLIRRGTIKKLENYPNIECIAQVSNGKDALEIMEKQKPDFVITDMKMPIMDGMQLLPILSIQYTDTFIIVISGYKDFEYAKEALRANTLDYIVKPFSKESIWEAVTRVVNRLEDRENLNQKITLNEAEKEKLKYEYDRQILKNILFGMGQEISSLSSQKMARMSAENYVLVTVVAEEINESELLEFMFMRNMEMNTVILQKDNVENMCFILVFFSEKASYDIKIKLLEMKDSVERFFESCRIHPFYGISGKHSSLKELHEAFLESTDALNQMTMIPEKNYMIYEEGIHSDCIIVWPKAEQFMFLIEAGKIGEAEVIFPELFHYFARNEKCCLKNAKDYCLEMAEILKKSLPDEMQLHKSKAASLNLINNMNFIFSFKELEEYFGNLFKNMAMAFESAGVYSEKDVLDNVKKYIDLHYEKNITQEFVASLFRLNRSYLSSAFKSQNGISFVDYVNQVRISHAKALLRNTDKKMYQIAQSVGYENVKYFFRVFKKMEGITPEHYRNN